MILLNTYDNARKATEIKFTWGILSFSYETLIGFYDRSTEQGYRLSNTWGPTTGKHINIMHVNGYKIVKNEETLEKIVDRSLITYSLKHMNKRINPNAKS